MRCRLVHINEPTGDAATNAYLLQYDSAHGTWQHECSGEGSKLVRRTSHFAPKGIKFATKLQLRHA